MSMTETKPTQNDEVEDLDVIPVGAGFADFYLLDRLRGIGLSVQVFEAGDGPGGVWYWNCYPEARVDSPGPMYQFSREDLWRDWKFSELYPSWQEIREYFHYVGRCCTDPGCGWRPEPGRRRVVPFSVRKPAVPFKHHAEHRHHIPKPRYRVTNWPEYDAALRRRGSLTVWFTDEAIAAWRAEPRTTPGVSHIIPPWRSPRR